MSINKVVFKLVVSKIIFFTLILILKVSYTSAFENKILFKVNNEIITTVDMSEEINYLITLNKKINDFDKNTIINIAKNSLIREKIKKIELEKNLSNVEINKKDLDRLIESTYKNLGIDTLDNFENYLYERNISIKKVKEKLMIQRKWNQLIYNKYFERIKIDKEAIKNQLTNEKIKSYLISEIVFRANNKKELKEKFQNIKDRINSDDFETAAIIYSISDTSQNGGNIGWVKESSLSEIILKEISKISINKYTDPISIPGGFIIIKVKNIKTEKAVLNIEEETNRIINVKINNQLKQFSNIYLNKIKNNVFINEK